VTHSSTGGFLTQRQVRYDPKCDALDGVPGRRKMICIYSILKARLVTADAERLFTVCNLGMPRYGERNGLGLVHLKLHPGT
jgi:hypothetical protein